MAATLTFGLRGIGGWAAENPSTGQRSTGRFPDRLNVDVDLLSGQVDCGYIAPFSLAASGSVTIDLRGANGELDMLGAALSLAVVKYMLVVVTAGTVQVGPQAATNPWQGVWGGTGASYWSLVSTAWQQLDLGYKWPAVGPTAKAIKLVNPSGSVAAAGTILVLGQHT